MNPSEHELRYLLAARRWFHAKDVELGELSGQELSDLFLLMRQDGAIRSFEQFSSALEMSAKVFEQKPATAPATVDKPLSNSELEAEAARRRAENPVLVSRELVGNPDKLAGALIGAIKGPTRMVHVEPNAKIG